MNKVYLLDTNIVSEFSKKRADERVLDLYESRKNQCAISSITWQELVHGVARMPEGRRKNMVSDFVQKIGANIEVIHYDGFAADICGKTMGMFESEGKSIPYSDAQIAATALANGMVLVTHNTEGFQILADRAFLKMEDWFQA